MLKNSQLLGKSTVLTQIVCVINWHQTIF